MLPNICRFAYWFHDFKFSKMADVAIETKMEFIFHFILLFVFLFFSIQRSCRFYKQFIYF